MSRGACQGQRKSPCRSWQIVSFRSSRRDQGGRKKRADAISNRLSWSLRRHGEAQIESGRCRRSTPRGGVTHPFPIKASPPRLFRGRMAVFLLTSFMRRLSPYRESLDCFPVSFRPCLPYKGPQVRSCYTSRRTKISSGGDIVWQRYGRSQDSDPSKRAKRKHRAFALLFRDRLAQKSGPPHK